MKKKLAFGRFMIVSLSLQVRDKRFAWNAGDRKPKMPETTNSKTVGVNGREKH
jgi:hypothetical protein